MRQTPSKDNTELFLCPGRKDQERIFSKSYLTSLASFCKSFYKSFVWKKIAWFFRINGYSIFSAFPGWTEEYKGKCWYSSVWAKPCWKWYGIYTDSMCSYLLAAVLWRYSCGCVDEFLLLDIVMPLPDVTVPSCLLPPTSWDLQPSQLCQIKGMCEHSLICFGQN